MIRVVTVEEQEPAHVQRLCKVLFAAFGVGAEHQGTVHVPAGVRVGKELDPVKLIDELDAVKTFADAVKSDTARFGRWHGAMLSRGQYWPPSQYEAAFISAAHDEALIDATIAAADEALGASAS